MLELDQPSQTRLRASKSLRYIETAGPDVATCWYNTVAGLIDGTSAVCRTACYAGRQARGNVQHDTDLQIYCRWP